MDENVVFKKSDPGAQPIQPEIPQQPISQPSQPSRPMDERTSVRNPELSQPKIVTSENKLERPVIPMRGLETPITPQTQVQTPPVVPPSDVPPPPPPRSIPFKLIGMIAGGIIGILLLFLLVTRVVLPLFGGEKAPENVELVYWGLWEDKSVMQKLIDDFQRENPTIKVNYVRKDIKQYRESLTTQITNGTGPDLFRFHNSWVGMMKPYLSPLSEEAISPGEFKSAYFPVIQRDLTRSGAIYGLPIGIDTLSLFVNTELFTAAGVQPPRTWDEFVQIAKELTVKDQNGRIQTAGAAMGTYDNITHAPDLVALLLAQNGTDFADFSNTLANTDQALQFYTAFAKGEGSVWDATLDPSLVAFAKGNVAMYFGYSWDVFAFQEMNPDLKFSVNPVPNLPGRKLTIASYWVEGVSSKSQHPKEAMLFMKFLAQKETLQKFYSEVSKIRSFGEPYPRKDLAATLQSNALVYPFVSQAEFAVSTYFVSDTYDDGINAQMIAYLGNAVRSMLTNTSAGTALETLAQGVAQVLGKYGQ